MNPLLIRLLYARMVVPTLGLHWMWFKIFEPLRLKAVTTSILIVFGKPKKLN